MRRVRAMQMTRHEIVCVVRVWHLRMSARVTVLMAGLVLATSVRGRAVRRVLPRSLDAVLIHVPLVLRV